MIRSLMRVNLLFQKNIRHVYSNFFVSYGNNKNICASFQALWEQYVLEKCQEQKIQLNSNARLVKEKD